MHQYNNDFCFPNVVLVYVIIRAVIVASNRLFSLSTEFKFLMTRTDQRNYYIYISGLISSTEYVMDMALPRLYEISKKWKFMYQVVVGMIIAMKIIHNK